MKKVVVFTGSGVSAESGLKTFRDSDGLWESYRIEDVATPQAWLRDASMVLEFYNQRRKQVLNAKPNAAHEALAELENHFNVQIITQNIDDLHERAGSKHVIHLHGEIRKARSTADPNLISEIEGWELNTGDICKKGSQLRPHIVWFGEMVPELDRSIQVVNTADIFIVIGTSLSVYPAASLVNYVPYDSLKYFIDPKASGYPSDFTVIKQNAGSGTPFLVNELIRNYSS